MTIRVDTHTHSVASLHAYSTVDELARAARRARMRGFVLTDHGPALQGTPHPYHFSNLKVIPPKIGGVFFFRGAELNILDADGTVDLPASLLGGLHFVLAGLHEGCFAPASREENTRALVAAIKNPFVDAISHPANPAFPVDFEAVVEAARSWGKALEINNSSFTARPGSDRTCPALAKLCAERGAFVVCGSDAHYHGDVGNFSRALPVIENAGIRLEQLVNRTLESFLDFLEDRRSTR